MNPTTEQLNARNKAVGLPMTQTGALPTLTTNFSSPAPKKITSPIVSSQMAKDRISDIGTAIENTNQDIRNVGQYKSSLESQKKAEGEMKKAQEQELAKEDPLAALISSLGDESQQQVISSNQQANKVDKNYLQQVSNAIDQMNNGTFPLSVSEKSAVDNLRVLAQSVFEDAQSLTDEKVAGRTALNARSGLQMYSPTESISRIAKVVQEGQQKITDINTKLIENQASLEQAFKDKNFKTAESLYKRISDTIKERNEEIKTINEEVRVRRKEVTDFIKEERDREQKVQEEITKNKNEILVSLGKSMTPVPPEVIQAVQDATDVGEAIAAAGQYMQDVPTTGTLGEYFQYKKEGGQMNFKDYKNWDENNKIRVAEAVDQLGLNKEQRNRVASLQDDYTRDIKEIKTVLTQSENIKALGEQALSTNPDSGSRNAAQIGVIFSYMKMLDPTSTVREGEYATAQNTAGVSDQIRNYYNKVKDGSFLTDKQIQGYVATAEKLAEVRRRNKETIDEDYDRKSTIFGIPKGVVTGVDSASKALEQEKVAKETIDNYIKNNPSEAEAIANMYDVEGTTDQDVYEFLKGAKKI